MKLGFVMSLIAALSVPAFAETKDSASAPIADNSTMRALFADDQRVRKPDYKGDWGDEARRTKVRILLEKGALKTGTDFEKAAFVFQHGDTPDDFLLAHTLAMVAVAKGDKRALWIASATLDRYLQRIGRKQIYGTQYELLDDRGRYSSNGQWTPAPYDRKLISDALRRDLGVPTQAEQKVQFENLSGDFKRLRTRLKSQATK